MIDFMKLQLLLFSCLLALPCDGQICNFRGKSIGTPEGPTTSIFGLNSTIEYDGSQLIIDSESMVIEDINATTFENQKEMRMQLQCAFSPATDFRESISGEILTFSLDAPQNGNSISRLAHIQFQDYGRRLTFVLINGQYLYEFVNAEAYTLDLATVYETSETQQIEIQYVSADQISGSIVVVTEAVFEEITEQQLLRDGYDSISVIPAVLEIDYKQILMESSDCTAAVIEEVPTTILVKEAYSVLTPVPAVLRTYKSLIIDTYAYEGQGYYERSPIDLTNTEVIYATGINITSVDPDCGDAKFLTCAAYDINQDTTFIATGIGTVYPVCDAGYQSAGIYCMTETTEVPNTYKDYYYERLDMPATASAVEIPAEYITTTLSRITNKDKLDESCIISTYDSIAYEKLIIDAEVVQHAILPRYATTISKRIITGPEIEAITSEENPDTLSITSTQQIEEKQVTSRLLSIDADCMHEAVRLALLSEELLLETDSIKSVAYYQAIIDYQISANLRIGVIDQSLLQSLNISI